MNVHPIFAPILKSIAPKADWYVLEDMRGAITRHLNAALIECSAMSQDLSVVDPDQLMVDIRAAFDPLLETATVQDCFSDAFHAAVCKLKDAGLEPIARANTLPSGAAL